MRRVVLRVAMAIIGVLSLVVYLGGAYLTYLLLRWILADRPSATTIVLIILAVTLLLGYLSYRFGTAQLLASVEAVDPDGKRVEAFHARLDRLCKRMELAKPTVLFTDLDEPNAFAMSGPDGGVVVFDITLFSLLDDDQLEAILAHELAHLESHDGLVQLLAFTGLQTVVGMLSFLLLPAMLFLTGVAKASAWLRGKPSTWSRSLAWRFRTVVFGVVMVVPVIVTFVLLVRSRRREYAADRRAALVTGKPLALASALSIVHEAVSAELRLKGLLPEGDDPRHDPVIRLLSTHPGVERRIEKLERMAER